MSATDCIVIGAGVVGLAVARALALSGREVIIVEQERQAGQHTSSRNSEVVHAGIHYPAGSHKARLCVAGREALCAYCGARGVAYRRCGKLTVAARAADLDAPARIEQQARAAGVEDLRWLDAEAVQRLAPSCVVSALYSPSTGILDAGGYLQALLADAQNAGAQLAVGTRVTGLRSRAGEIEVCTAGADQPVARARLVINCAGLWASEVAASLRELPRAHLPRVYFGKGTYFALLVYPVAPATDSHLGIHLTLDLSGCARFGPDLQCSG